MKQASRVLTLLLGLASVWGIARADVAPAAAAAPEMDMIDQITQPVWFFNWGLDTRMRQEYQANNGDLNHSARDEKNITRWRSRVWSEFGPFLKDSALDVPNGLTAYIRMVYEPRYKQSGTHAAMESRQFNEFVLDNLYVTWQRMAGLPMAVRVGRQDLNYGRNWITGDGTPADGGRTAFCDAIKASLYLDPANTLDLFVANNKSNNRIDPINDEHRPLCEYDADVFGAYLISNYFKPQQVHAYYIYKSETREINSAKLPATRTVHTLGGLVQGKFAPSFDYYVEGAGQWGRECGVDRSAYGFNSDLGYTFDAACKPRVHGFYEHLSGDNPHTREYEGWDAVLGRWPQWSEIFANRYKTEGGLGANYSNLQRLGVGVSCAPTSKLTAMIDYSYLLANKNTFGKTGRYGDGHFRGHLTAAKLFYKFDKRLSAHLWAEYLHPGDYYSANAQDACFLRWEIMYEFKPIVRR